MAAKPKGRVNLERMRSEYEKFRSSVASKPAGGKISFRAVARLLEDVHLEGRVRGHQVESDEPPERGGPTAVRHRSTISSSARRFDC